MHPRHYEITSTPLTLHLCPHIERFDCLTLKRVTVHLPVPFVQEKRTPGLDQDEEDHTSNWETSSVRDEVGTPPAADV